MILLANLWLRLILILPVIYTLFPPCQALFYTLSNYLQLSAIIFAYPANLSTLIYN